LEAGVVEVIDGMELIVAVTDERAEVHAPAVVSA
jgi:hypothetical protein